MTIENAKGCPLCGSLNLTKQSQRSLQSGFALWLHCEDCGLSGGHIYDSGWDAVIEKWNRRMGELPKFDFQIDSRLAEIEERTNAATPGDWYAYEWNETKRLFWIATSNPAVFAAGEDKGSVIANEKNAKFISHARADIPFLLSLVKPMRAATEKFNAAKRYISTLTRVIKSLGPSLPYVELTQALREYEAATSENGMQDVETLLPIIDLDRENMFGNLMLGESFWYQGEKAIKRTDSAGSFTGGQILPFNEYDIVQTRPPLNSEVP